MSAPELVSQEAFPNFDSPCGQPITDEGNGVSASGLLLSASNCSKKGTYNPFVTASRWHYVFAYSMREHSPHDQIHGEITFNFVNATSPTPSAEPVKFTITEDGVEKENLDRSKVTALRVTVKLKEDLPRRVGSPLIEICPLTAKKDSDGTYTLIESDSPYKCERVDTGDTKTGTFLYKDSNGNYLETSKAKYFQTRWLVLPDINIIERQSALTQLYLTRNSDVEGERSTTQPIVYTSPKISFANPVIPYVTRTDMINLATVFSTDMDKPVLRTLECQLNCFYEAFFGDASVNDVTFKLGTSYGYDLIDPPEKGNQSATIRTPIFLMTATKTAIRIGGSGIPLNEVITGQVKRWEEWRAKTDPKLEGGNVFFDLAVFSDVMEQPMPILTLPGLYVSVAYLKRPKT